MTKLEQKLQELEKRLINLGYRRVLQSYGFTYIKHIKQHIIHLEFFTKSLELDSAFLEVGQSIKTQEVLDNLQQAFNVMQKDLEELKKCQEQN